MIIEGILWPLKYYVIAGFVEDKSNIKSLKQQTS